jgi:hypothetical protein
MVRYTSAPSTVPTTARIFWQLEKDRLEQEIAALARHLSTAWKSRVRRR